jgi:hypothetical protein
MEYDIIKFSKWLSAFPHGHLNMLAAHLCEMLVTTLRLCTNITQFIYDV